MENQPGYNLTCQALAFAASFSFVFLLLVSRDPRWGNQERNQYSCGRSCNGERENIFDTSHVCLEHKSERVSAESVPEVRRASRADAARADIWSCGC
jgi:hypothetical protein